MDELSNFDKKMVMRLPNTEDESEESDEEERRFRDQTLKQHIKNEQMKASAGHAEP